MNGMRMWVGTGGGQGFLLFRAPSRSTARTLVSGQMGGFVSRRASGDGLGDRTGWTSEAQLLTSDRWLLLWTQCAFWHPPVIVARFLSL